MLIIKMWIFCFFFAAVTASGQSTGASPKAGLYSVLLADKIEFGRVESRVKGKKRLVFRNHPFRDDVKTYQVFLVLDDEKANVIAETVVIEKTEKRATVRIVNLADAYTVEDLVGKNVIRFDALRQSMGNSIIFRENPNLQLALVRQSFVLTSANVLTGANLNPLMFSSGILFEAFLPKNIDLQWLNWLGVRFQTNEYSPSTLNLRRAKTDRTEEATLAGSANSTEIVVQPWFDRFFIYHLAFLVGLKNVSSESITVVNSSETLTMNLMRDSASYGLEFATNPVPNIYSGITMRQISSHFTTEESSTLSSSQLRYGEGNWQTTRINLWGEMIEGVINHLKVRVRFSLDRNEDTVTDLVEVGLNQDQVVSDWGYTLEVGLLYVP